MNYDKSQYHVLFDLFVLASPSVQIIDYWITSAPVNNPNNLLVRIIDFLVLTVPWNQRKITLFNFYSLSPILKGDFADAFGRIDNGVLITVCMNDGSRVWFRSHDGSTDTLGLSYDCRHSSHASRLSGILFANVIFPGHHHRFGIICHQCCSAGVFGNSVQVPGAALLNSDEVISFRVWRLANTDRYDGEMTFQSQLSQG